MHWLPENALKFSKIIEFCFVFDQISLKILPTTDSRNSNNRRIMQTTNSKMREFCPRSETCKNFTAQLPVVAKLHSFKVSKQNVTFLVTCVMILTKFDVWVVRSRTPPPGWDFDQFLFFRRFFRFLGRLGMRYGPARFLAVKIAKVLFQPPNGADQQSY